MTSLLLLLELEASLSTPNEAVSTGQSKKDDSKANGQLRSRIKVCLEYMTDEKCVTWLAGLLAWVEH